MIQFRGMDPRIRPYAEYAHELARWYGYDPLVVSVRRSVSEQRELYDRYLEGRSRFPANPPGQSSHNYGLAWDSWVPEALQKHWTALRRWVGFEVPENDWPHAHAPSWRSWL